MALVTLGCHWYLLTQPEDLAEAVFTRNSVSQLRVLKSAAEMLGPVIVSLPLVFQISHFRDLAEENADPENTDPDEPPLSILNISYGLQLVYQHYIMIVLLPWFLIYLIGRVFSDMCCKGKPPSDEK